MPAKARRRRGEGSVEKLPGGRFRAIFSLGVRDGKRTKTTYTHKDKERCYAWLRQKQLERDRGQLVDDHGFTVGSWLTHWLDGYKGQVEPNTYAAVKSHVHEHLLRSSLRPIRLTALRPFTVSQLYADMAKAGVSAAMQHKIGSTLHAALKEAVRLQLIVANPAAGAKKPKCDRPDMQTWSAAEVSRFLDSLRPDRLYSLFVLALDTGMRQGELFGLQWPDVDLAAGRVRVVHSLEESVGSPRRLKKVKTKASRRLLVLSPACVEALRRHRQLMRAEGRDVDEGMVFTSAHGKLLWKTVVRIWSFESAIKRAGVPWIRFHDLRHTHATLSLADGANLRAVSARLGHANPAFTLRVYCHCLPEFDERIAQIWDRLLSPLAREEESAQPTSPREEE